ncbi:MAG TPA: ABC transporter permease [Candidatus Saccharimonadia bacterium]|nr:ABC transporter permease [Candidatus Saccharimonadia bacterium]
MKLYQAIRQSLKAILRNKGRSFLTILGIIIGIGSVIALISLGAGVQASVSSQVSKLGATTLVVTPGEGLSRATAGSSSSQSRSQQSSGGPGARGGGFAQAASTLSVADLTSLQDRAKHPHIQAAAGNVSGSAIFTAAGQDQRYTILGTSPSYFTINNLKIARGQLLSDADSAAKVVVLGEQFAAEVLGSTKVVGQTLVINGDTYRIAGVMAKANESSFANPNDEAFVPYQAAMATFGTPTFNSLMIEADAQSSVDAVKSDIQTTLLANHKITDAKLADFSVSSAKDLLSAITQITGLLTSLLAGIAAISLVVGGIGIMNIMLVSVTERTREIGLRKAVGARTADILGQFVTEAMMLTLIGGLLGIGLGKLIGLLAAKVLQITPVITPGAVLLAVGVSSAVGLVFGIYPAAKAARLNPIDALRYE